jgi:hypothetical protein
MDYAALAKTVLAHPLTWALVTLIAAPVAAWIVQLQLKALGLHRRIQDRGVPWDLAFAFLTFWIVLAVGLGAVAEQAGLEGLHYPLTSLASRLFGLLPAGLILAGASHYRRLRTDEARERSKEALEATRSELRWLQLIAGALAALAVLGGGLLWPLLLLAAGGLVLWWVVSPSARAQLRAWRASYAAGQRLRAELSAGTVVEGPAGRLSLANSVGLISTDVLEGGQLHPMDNSVLLERVEAGVLSTLEG